MPHPTPRTGAPLRSIPSLWKYLRTLKNSQEREDFARRCGTSVVFLQHCSRLHKRASFELAVAIERETKGAVRIEELRPDLDISHIRARPAEDVLKAIVMDPGAAAQQPAPPPSEST